MPSSWATWASSSLSLETNDHNCPKARISVRSLFARYMITAPGMMPPRIGNKINKRSFRSRLSPRMSLSNRPVPPASEAKRAYFEKRVGSHSRVDPRALPDSTITGSRTTTFNRDDCYSLSLINHSPEITTSDRFDVGHDYAGLLRTLGWGRRGNESAMATAPRA